MCEKCKDIGFILVKNEEGIEVARECECRQVMIAKSRLKSSGINEEMQSITFKDFNTLNDARLENAKSVAINYLKNFTKTENERRNSALFSGQVGSGKTMLTLAICNNLMNVLKVGVCYMSYRDSITELKQIMTDKIDYDKALNRYKNARVLVIDDFLKGNITQSDVNIMFEIINYRYTNNKACIISTEKTLNQIIDFDEAVGSRIIEMSRGNTVELHGKELNYRLRDIESEK